MTGMARASESRRRPAVPAPEGWLALVAFATPTLLWMEIEIVGRIFVSEIVLIGLLPFLLLARGRMLAAPMPAMFLALAALWLAGQIVTDLVRETEFRDYARGWTRIAFTVLNFCAIYLLVHGSRYRFVLFALGLACGGLLSYLINPSEFAEEWPWKFGIGLSTAVIAALVSLSRPMATIPFLPALPLLLVCAYSVTVGSRALAGVTFAASFYVLFQQMFGRRSDAPTRGSLGRILLFCAAGVGLAGFLLGAFGLAVEKGYTDERSAQIFERQREGGLGLLFGGRSEIFASAQAVMDRPILGHGSWAKNPDYVVRILDARLHGYDIHYMSRLDMDLIPTHSHLMGAWVEAGILGALLWMWVIFLVLRVLSTLYLSREPLGPLIALIGFLMLWDVLFSPFGAERRLTVPFSLVLMMFAWDVLQARVARAAPAAARRPRQRPRPPPFDAGHGRVRHRRAPLR